MREATERLMCWALADMLPRYLVCTKEAQNVITDMAYVVNDLDATPDAVDHALRRIAELIFPKPKGK